MSFFQNQIVKMLTDMLSHVDTPAFILDGQGGRLYGWNDHFAALFPNQPEPGCPLSDLLPSREVCDWLADYYQQKFTPDENWRPDVWSFLLEGLEDEPVNVRLEIIHFGEKTGLLVVSFIVIRDWLAGAEPDHLGTLLHDFTGAAAFMDLEGRFQIANKPTSEFLQLPMSEIINRSFMDIFPDDISWPLETIFHRAISSGEDQLEEMETQATGESVWLQVMFNVVRKNGHLIGAYFSAQDTRRIGTVENEEEEGDDNFFNMDFGDDPLPAGEHILTDGGTPQLIHFDGGNFEADARRLLAFLGEAASADRVDIWQIHKSSFDDDPEEYVSQLYEWSAVEREAEDAPVIAGRLLSQTIPNWLEAFTAGETINDPVKHMPPEERQALEELGVQSIMAAPVRVHGKLWGFIGLQDCRNERRFSQTDEKALMLASSMFDLLLQKQSMKGELDEARQARETASIQLEQALAREHELAGRAETSRAGQDEFLATMSREIVPPTQAIMEMIELVTHSNLTEGQREFLARADAAAKDLLQTMKDIVDMAKIEAGELAAENRPYDLGDVLGAVSSAMSDRAAERNLDFKIMVARGLPTGYVGDERRLGQVLINLVENALKYTEEGAAITITVDPAREVDYLSFKVKDTGRGLSQENMDELFTPLRLALSRELVFLMGGEMYCESEPGQGSTFYFTIQAPRIGG